MAGSVALAAAPRAAPAPPAVGEFATEVRPRYFGTASDYFCFLLYGGNCANRTLDRVPMREASDSGLFHHLGKVAGPKGPRAFESLRLRQYPQ